MSGPQPSPHSPALTPDPAEIPLSRRGLLAAAAFGGSSRNLKLGAVRNHRRPRPLAAGAVTQEWASFLGPQHAPVSLEKPLVKSFAAAPPLLWEVARGEGYSGAAVVGGRVLQFHRLGDQEVVECLDAETGRRHWHHASPSDYIDRYGFSGGPRCRPVSDGQRVVTLGVGGRLSCLDLRDGRLLWQRDLLKEFRLKQNFFGVGATPLLEQDLVIVNVGAPQASVVGFRLESGKPAWQSGKEWGPSYSSPIPATFHGKRRVLVFAGGESQPATGGLICLDPATGKVDFQLPWRARRYESVNASSPLVLGNKVFISECYGKGGTLVEITPQFKPKTVWTSESLGTHFMTAVAEDGHLYGIDGHGPMNAPMVCIDAATGEEKWREEPEWSEGAPPRGGMVPTSLNPGLANLLRVDGRCLMLSEYGHVVWIDLNPKGYKELSRARLFQSQETWCLPALSRGLLYVVQTNPGRDGSQPRLLCYDLRG